MQMFKDKNGKTSSTRVSMFLCVLAAILFGFMGVVLCSREGSTLSLIDVSILCAMYLTAGFGGKAVGSVVDVFADLKKSAKE